MNERIFITTLLIFNGSAAVSSHDRKAGKIVSNETGADKIEPENEKSADKTSWSEWGRWSPCSVTCGDGVRIRRRRCLKDDGAESEADGGGGGGGRGAQGFCEGETEDDELCSLNTCPNDKTSKPEFGDHIVGTEDDDNRADNDDNKVDDGGDKDGVAESVNGRMAFDDDSLHGDDDNGPDDSGNDNQRREEDDDRKRDRKEQALPDDDDSDDDKKDYDKSGKRERKGDERSDDEERMDEEGGSRKEREEEGEDDNEEGKRRRKRKKRRRKRSKRKGKEGDGNETGIVGSNSSSNCSSSNDSNCDISSDNNSDNEGESRDKGPFVFQGPLLSALLCDSGAGRLSDAASGGPGGLYVRSKSYMAGLQTGQGDASSKKVGTRHESQSESP